MNKVGPVAFAAAVVAGLTLSAGSALALTPVTILGSGSIQFESTMGPNGAAFAAADGTTIGSTFELSITFDAEQALIVNAGTGRRANNLTYTLKVDGQTYLDSSLGGNNGSYVMFADQALWDTFYISLDQTRSLPGFGPSRFAFYHQTNLPTTTFSGAPPVPTNLDFLTAPGAYIFDSSLRLGDGQGSVVFNRATNTQFALAPVPEPATWALMIGGFAGSGVALRRRRTRAA